MIPAFIFNQTLRGFMEPIAPFLDDDSVSEIMINGPDRIYIERGGLIEKTDARFSSHDALLSALRNLAQYVGRSFDASNPILEGRLPDGSRVEAIVPPAAPEGPTVSIRRFSRNTITLDRLVELGSLTSDAVDLIRALVAGKLNIVVSGGTASGKTSMLNAVSGAIGADERIVVIEDARELQLQQAHVVPLEAQPPDPEGKGAVSIRDLFKATLRLRPDRIVVGEIRGGEAIDLIQALTSGHGGGMTTLHASHSLDALNRLETMALMSDVALPLLALRSQVASAVDFVIQVSRMSDGSRSVEAITEVVGFDGANGYECHDIVRREMFGRDDFGRVISELRPTGYVPSCAGFLANQGFSLPAVFTS